MSIFRQEIVSDKLKIVFLGGQAVGKSSIIEKYIHDNFNETANV